MNLSSFTLRCCLLWAVVLVLPSTAWADGLFPIGRYESSPRGFSTNSWWVEGPEGVVLIDTQFIPSATADAVRTIEDQTGKKVVGAFVLHANPDKFNGTQYLQSRGIRVITSQQVIDVMPKVDALRREWFYDRYKPDYPAKLALPESLGNQSTKVKLAGIPFQVHVLGPCVSEAHILVQLGDAVFTGDILANKHHAWLELGLVDEWLAVLHKIADLKPLRLYPGRGNSAGPALLKEQEEYLQYVRQTVVQMTGRKQLNKNAQQKVATHIENHYADYQNEYFLNLGVPAVWRRYRKD